MHLESVTFKKSQDKFFLRKIALSKQESFTLPTRVNIYLVVLGQSKTRMMSKDKGRHILSYWLPEATEP